MRMSKKSRKVTHVTKGEIEPATGEAPGDERFSAAGRDEQMTDNLRQVGE